MVRFSVKGNLSKTYKFLKTNKKLNIDECFRKYGDEGVAALRANTPKDTGLTSESWYYTITKTSESVTLSFSNSNVNDNVLIAVVIQYGHATSNGGWVEGRDYINPSIRPVFDRIAKDAWEEVANA